ncbi:trithorax group protein osa isoform X2 [Wyeomyia smithii]|uniref:trithorax group protein osa isoform X2 n=1 Tax=Wyeomyia smithii TaxID=174621 RepID=UPI002467EF4C|nr:trithorax group protein osa isoform X2 [Wyeomyia smithii]
MAQQQTEINESLGKANDIGADQQQTNKSSNLQNGTDTQPGGKNSQSGPVMGGEKAKSLSGAAAGGNGGNAPSSPASAPPHPPHPGSENAPGMHPYESSGHHMPPTSNAGSADPNNKDEIHHHPQHHPMHQQHPQHHQHQMFGQPPMQHQQYPRYHHDPNMPPGDPYAHYRMSASPGGKPGSMIPPNRPPPQRYMQGPGGPGGHPPGQHPGHPGQPTQGPTPTLNSLLQSHPPGQHPQHRYPNSYDPNQPQPPPSPGPGQPGAQPGQQQPQQQPPPGQPPQPYGHQQSWAPPPRPYSPQMGSQPYRPPPPGNNARGQPPYPPGPPNQSPGSYPPPQQQQTQGQQQQPVGPQGQPGGQQGAPPSPQGHQQPGGQPPPGSSAGSGPPPPSSQGPPPPQANTQYTPYQQRYPTPPGPNSGPNHRSPYPPPHQYEPVRSWPSPAASPGPGGQPQQSHLPPSPHGPPQSPGQHGAPSPSPQPPQPAQSPHQDSTGQNSNDSSSGGGTGGASAAPGTPNSQGMRPSPSPTGSSGSRSMSPAVGQQSLPMPPRPSSSHSQVPNQQAPNQLGSSSSSNLGHGNQSQSQQPPDHSRVASPNRPPSVGGPQQGPPGPPPSQASMAAQGYQTQPPHPPHMHGGYKMGPSPGGPGAGMPGPQQMSPYPPHNPQSQQYSPHSQGSYSPRPQYPGGYGPSPPGGQPGQPPPPVPPPSSVTSGPGGYSGHRMPNHVGGPPPHSQYPPHQPYQQGWGPPGPGPQVPGGHINNHQQQPGKGMPPTGVPPSPQQPNQAQSQQGPPTGGPPQSGSPRPLNYLKQHLQHKGGYGGAPSPTPPQGYGNGPGMHPPMGPPHHMGPPMGPTSMGPPSGTPPNQQGLPPQSQSQAGPNSHSDGSLPPQPPHPESGPIGALDNGVSSSGPGGGMPHPVTSLVTTGPDGATLDEASQQSTLSNTSVASGEDPQCSTPKSRKGELYNQSHLTSTPTTASPGPHNQHEDFEMNSPTSWPRTPASPVFNSHVPPTETPFRSTKKSDSLNKLYDMDDKPERRPWLDKLLAFMEERRTPITACPTISKTPLDLYKLYTLVQERGGFLEVCKVTKSKTWKDIAGLLGIGASSSAAYTLRKHYTKNLLPFECKFDRGGIDPGPIIAQVEAGSKKKSNKTASVPSPGSSNSQDSFPAPGSSSASMDGYGTYPGGGYPPGATADYQNQQQQSGQPQQPPTQPPQPQAQPNLQRPPSQQSGTQSPHPGSATPTTGDNISVSNPFDDPVGPQRPPYQQGAPYPPASRPQGAPYQAQPGGYQYGAPDQYGPGGAPGQYPPGQQGQYPPAGRPMYPPYAPPESSEGRSTPPAPGSAPPAAGDPYRGYGSAPYPPPPQQRPYQQPPPVSSGPSQTPPAGPPGAASQPPVSGAPGQQQPPSTQGQGYPATPQPPQQPDYYRQDQPNQPRRHPDFEKNQQPYPPYQQRPQMYPGGWQSGAAQYRGQYPPQGPQQQWGTHNGPRPSGPPGPPAGPPGTPGTPNQWNADASRYPPSQQQPPYPPHQQGQQQPWNQMPPTSQGSPLRPPPRGGKPFASMQQPGMVGSMPAAQPQVPGGPVGGSTAGPVSGPTVAPAPSATGQPGAVGPSKPMPAAPFPPTSSVAPKRDIVFPSDSIESTTPVTYRRKRINKLDIGQTDPWRIFMALRSGLLVESTWALDVLNILLFDDSSVVYFGLTHLPGLLNLLLDHFQKSLSDMFDTKDRKNRHGRAYGWFGKEVDDGSDEEETESMTNDEKKAIEGVKLEEEEPRMEIKKEVGSDDIKIENGEVDTNADGMRFKKELHQQPQHRVRGCKRARKTCDLDLGSVVHPPNPEDRIVVFNSTTNYTMSSRKGLPVKIQPADDDVFVLEHRREWDKTADHRYHRETEVGGDPWTAGHSEPDPHDYIMETFQAEFVNIPFARMIKTSKKYKARCKNNNNSSSTNNNLKRTQNKYAIESDDSDSEHHQQLKQPQRSRTNGDSRIMNGDESSEAEEDTKPPSALAGVKNLVVKKELNEVTASSDADCREIDMELEKSSLSNGPQDAAAAEESDTAAKESSEVKMEIEEECNATQRTVNEEEREKKFNVAATIRDPAKVLKRRRMSDYEDECYTRDEASLYLVTEGHDCLARRCVAISNILRNLTFVPGNETEFARSSRFLSILGKLLLLNHEHPMRTKKTRNYDREEDADFSDSCSSLQGESEWWWDFLVQIRENMLVSMANISGQLDLSRFDEPISRPILDGLLHWSVCPSAHGQDPFPTLGINSVLSPQRLALEALCKLCVTDANVDLVIATPPFTRLEKLCSVLTRHLCKNEDQVLREFSVNLLHYLAAADSAMARTVAMQSPCVSYLVAFIEQAEQTALGVANQHGINYLRDNPDSMGTSLDMLRRAAGTLLHLARHPDNRPLFMQQEQRLLGLVMSHILDQQVALIISKVLFQCSRGTGPLTTMEIESPSSSNRKESKKSTDKDHPSEATKSSMHLNSIIANSGSNNAAMAPPPPSASLSSGGGSTSSKSSEPLTQLTSSSPSTTATMPAPSAPVSASSGPPAFVPPPAVATSPSSTSLIGSPTASGPADVGSPPAPPTQTPPTQQQQQPPQQQQQHPIIASS